MDLLYETFTISVILIHSNEDNVVNLKTVYWAWNSSTFHGRFTLLVLIYLLCMSLLKLSNERGMLEEELGHRSAIIKSRLLMLLMSLSKDILICILKYICVFPSLIKKAF